MKRIKKKSYENLSDENIQKVIALLNPEEGKPLSKKDACGMLNISYNTTRLNKIVEDYAERQEYTAKRKKMNRGKAATQVEIQEAITDYLRGESVSVIAKRLYRSPGFIKHLIEKIGVPQRPTSAEDKEGVDIVPDECISDVFDNGEIVWSAKYHTTAVVGEEMSVPYQSTKKGLSGFDYEDKYDSKCYEIYVVEKVDSEGTLFPNVETGGFNAYALAYDLAKLTHLEEHGIKLDRI